MEPPAPNAFVRFVKYLFGKRSELADLEFKDAVLAKVVLDIHRKRVRKEKKMVPLYHLYRVHRLDRENALAATRKRIDTLREHRQVLLEDPKGLTAEVIGRVLPSVSPIMVVKEADNRYIAFEGNGRLAALQEVFAVADDVNVEVEEHCFSNPRKIVRRLRRVQRLNRIPSEGFLGLAELAESTVAPR